MIYSGDGDVVAPRAFKRLIGDICPQFQGYNQHDSQELLNFLLDGLHEDTNRILVKECTDPIEAKGRPDNEVAKEFLEVCVVNLLLFLVSSEPFDRLVHLFLLRLFIFYILDIKSGMIVVWSTSAVDNSNQQWCVLRWF